jgi:hypothetical protein
LPWKTSARLRNTSHGSGAAGHSSSIPRHVPAGMEIGVLPKFAKGSGYWDLLIMPFMSDPNLPSGMSAGGKGHIR